ncbi:monovalent cation/H(+) antiporter subunit G [Cysteiniphilum halobium]|uniref:monovalent cation/H(+) antiporter subunit G n=1 Tax=Cysteiniphilum halobium TaxID=2219059 RepID=UPI003F865A79
MLAFIGSLCIFLGALFVLIASIGLYRFQDLYLKMHAATKSGTLGSGLVLLGVALYAGDIHIITEVILLILFIGITNPISAHIIAKTYLNLNSK